MGPDPKGATVTGPASSDSTSTAPEPSAASGGWCPQCPWPHSRLFPCNCACHGTGAAPEAKGQPPEGLYRKYNVARTDGSSGPGGKHECCSYFVLDLDHDQYSIPALRSYADACRAEYPELAADLECEIAERAEPQPPAEREERQRADAAEEALQTSRALCDELRASESTLRKQLDDIATALHPHWTGEGHTYLPDQLAERAAGWVTACKRAEERLKEIMRIVNKFP